jgi:phage shock protein PspC (stress-responsive transcriptional regulator)
MAGKQDKEAAKQAKREKKAASKARRGQLFEAFKMQRREDPMLIPWMVGSIVVVAGVLFGVGFIFNIQWTLLPLGVVLGILLAVIIFGRRVQRTVYGKADGQPGAGAWALENLRGKWKVTPTVAATTQLDAVHRVLGHPGVILVAEGAPHRVKGLLAQEKKRVSRLVGDTPIYDVTIGHEDKQIPLKKLQSHLTKLPRNLKPAQVDALEAKLAALGNRGAALPKGPMPAGAKMRNVQRTIRRR